MRAGRHLEVTLLEVVEVREREEDKPRILCGVGFVCSSYKRLLDCDMGMEKGRTVSLLFNSGLRAYPFGPGTRFLSTTTFF